MKTIYKYKIIDEGARMPEGAKILSVGLQDDKMMLWALVDTDRPVEMRLISIIGTGWKLDDMTFGRFIGTVFQGPFVWHVFEGV